MSNGLGKGFSFPIREKSPLQKLQGVVVELIDFILAVAAMNLEKGNFSHEQLFRMEAIIKDVRRKMGASFTIEDGMKAVRTAFRLENPDT